MQLSAMRAGRRPLARTIIILAAAGALGGCADATTAPAPNPAPATSSDMLARSPDQYTTSVDLAVVGATYSPVYGTVVQLSIACSTTEVLDLGFGLMQEWAERGSKVRIEGSTTIERITCTPTPTSYAVQVSPYYGTTQFQPGRATAYGQVLRQPEWVEPAQVTRRVRVADLSNSPL